MRIRPPAILLAGLLLSLLPPALAQTTPNGLAQLSTLCGTESRPGWRQLFANTGSQWRRYNALSAIPEPAAGSGRVAQVWQGPMGMTLVAINTTRAGAWVQTSYCYAAGELLSALTHEVRTSHGWAFLARQQYDHSGQLVSNSVRFIDGHTGHEVKRPRDERAKDLDLLNPPVYFRFSDLPFAALYQPLKDSEKY